MWHLPDPNLLQQNDNSLRTRFINAIASGTLGRVDESGTVFTLKEFKQFFSEIKTDYINSFLPASIIESGRMEMSHTKFLFRIRKGVYRVHPQLLLDLEGEVAGKEKEA